MDYIEAIAWLKGERSTCNTYFHSGCNSNESNLLTAKADAAMTEQAYWVAKAHTENLTSGAYMQDCKRTMNDDQRNEKVAG